MELENATEWDLESTPLEIKTDSVMGSSDKVAVVLLSGNAYTGVVYLFFTSPQQYHLSWCTAGNYKFHVNPPSDNDKIWRISLTRTAGVRLVIHCNEVEVLNTLLSQATCSDSEWSTYWSRDVTKIKFTSSDKASDYYRPQPGDFLSKIQLACYLTFKHIIFGI